MAPEHSVQFTSGSPETVLEPLSPEVADALAAATALPASQQHAAVSAVAARDPRCLEAWATLAELADAPCGRQGGADRATCAGATNPTEVFSAPCMRWN
jgi:hypothetical protein